jgi:hypothetical protein
MAGEGFVARARFASLRLVISGIIPGLETLMTAGAIKDPRQRALPSKMPQSFCNAKHCAAPLGHFTQSGEGFP